jgi:hypothetical protein
MPVSERLQVGITLSGCGSGQGCGGEERGDGQKKLGWMHGDGWVLAFGLFGVLFNYSGWIF